MARPKVGEILLRAGLIDETQLRAALEDESSRGQRLGMTLVRKGLVAERDLVRALAQQLQLPVVALEGKRVQPEVLALVSVEFAEKHLCLPLFVKEGPAGRTLFVGMEDPANLSAIDDLAFKTGLKVQPVLVAPSEVCEAIDRYYHRRVQGPISSGSGSGLDLEEDFGDRLRAGVDHTPDLDDSHFPDFEHDEASAPGVGPEASPPVALPAAGGGETANRTILRALCHLLVEKGLVTREELQAQVAALEGESGRS